MEVFLSHLPDQSYPRGPETTGSREHLWLGILQREAGWRDDNFGEIYWDNGEIAHYVKYLAICVYPNKNNEFYLFCCDELYDVVGDSLWDSIEMCMAVANTSYGGQIIWIKNEM